ncbi:uncharacterized protein LOC128255726 isoform X11 [Drosophila gunungcola]|uniref:uncharacterized protein LOC128255726 isoform X11 n=1 Tax=Drosophila gunungcola TaxID=103775 RepID=UPI0022DECE17|nr:uncharacterized protein LOC128255726 isoform X11 [Drosophila gunungcola]
MKYNTIPILQHTKLVLEFSHCHFRSSSIHCRPEKFQISHQASSAGQRDEEWKSSPGHMSAAMMNTRLYNNAAAAVFCLCFVTPCMCSNTTASTDPAPKAEPETDPEPPTEIPSQSQTENEESDDEEDDSCSTSGSSQTGSTVHQRDVEVNETQPDPQAAQILEAATQLSNYPTVDTLTPATSSEDIFYSPIGSPTCFNTSLGTQALLKKASIQSVLAHSTPTSEPKDQPTEMVNTSTAQTPEPEPPKPQKEVHQQNQQQPQRQRNHSHQRYRGRNRR